MAVLHKSLTELEPGSLVRVRWMGEVHTGLIWQFQESRALLMLSPDVGGNQGPYSVDLNDPNVKGVTYDGEWSFEFDDADIRFTNLNNIPLGTLVITNQGPAIRGQDIQGLLLITQNGQLTEGDNAQPLVHRWKLVRKNWRDDFDVCLEWPIPENED